MKKLRAVFIAIITVLVFALCVACGGRPQQGPGGTGDTDVHEPVDYVTPLTLDLTSSSKKQEVTMRLHVDGDTTHFNPKYSSNVTCDSSDFAGTDGYIKARYIAINTPESTGKIEQWGGTASKFTRGKLEKAKSIIVESDTDAWNLDGNGRYVVWVWYIPEDGTEYKNLNLEILQEGLALGSSVSNNRYGEVGLKAMMEAQARKSYLFSGIPDPDFPGEAVPVTLKELRINVESYNNKRVKVEGTITMAFNNCVYIEDKDPETDIHYGMQVFYAYDTEPLRILKMGNRVSVVGVVMYYEATGTYQISDIKYDRFKPDDPDNSQLVEAGTKEDIVYTEVQAGDIVSGKTTVKWEEEVKDDDGKPVLDEDGNTVTEEKSQEFDYGYVVWHTSVTVKNLTVVSTYTTKTGNSKGAVSITCRAEDGTTITVRTDVLKYEDGTVIPETVYQGKTITVIGIVDYYKQEGQAVGQYQVKVCDFADIQFVG